MHHSPDTFADVGALDLIVGLPAARAMGHRQPWTKSFAAPRSGASFPLTSTATGRSA